MEDKTPIDKEGISKLVKDMVQTNGIGFIPDRLEEKLYTNVITMIMRLVDGLLTDLRLKFLGHELRLDLARSKDEQEPRPGDDQV